MNSDNCNHIQFLYKWVLHSFLLLQSFIWVNVNFA